MSFLHKLTIRVIVFSFVFLFSPLTWAQFESSYSITASYGFSAAKIYSDIDPFIGPTTDFTIGYQIAPFTLYALYANTNYNAVTESNFLGPIVHDFNTQSYGLGVRYRYSDTYHAYLTFRQDTITASSVLTYNADNTVEEQAISFEPTEQSYAIGLHVRLLDFEYFELFSDFFFSRMIAKNTPTAGIALGIFIQW